MKTKQGLSQAVLGFVVVAVLIAGFVVAFQGISGRPGAATAGPVTGYPAPAQTQSGYPAPGATQVGVGSPYPTPTDVPTVAPTPALPPLADSPDQFDPKTYGLPDAIASFKVLAVITSRNQACVYPPSEKQMLLQASAPTVQDYLKNTHATEIRQALDGLGLKPDEWTWSIVGPGATREGIIQSVQDWNELRQKGGCVQSVPPPTISPNSTP